ncbi:MAG: hypothetical protein H7Y27_04890 [Gemmatimonadaceae bacterium]|nr:hypothetical protein [Chitinophagaceae bacterium]
MKKSIAIIILAIVAMSASAQFSETIPGSLRLGAGYVKDFPGMGGFGVYTEYTMPMSDWLEGGIGLKRISTKGNPRTQSVTEFTKATTLDFNLLLIPARSEDFALKIGAGYSFSFYKIKRSFPVYENGNKEAQWIPQESKGRVSGISLLGEFEYFVREDISAGMRLSLSKAYSNVLMAGPFVAIRF